MFIVQSAKLCLLCAAMLVANNVLPTRTIAGQPFIFDREISEGPEVHLLPTPCTLGNPAAIQCEADVHDDVLAKLAWGNLYFYDDLLSRGVMRTDEHTFL